MASLDPLEKGAETLEDIEVATSQAWADIAKGDLDAFRRSLRDIIAHAEA